MGRPLNKKYFGNRNVGQNGYQNGAGDDFIGGEGIASVNFTEVGEWMATAGGANSPLSGLALPAPTIPGGVQATWSLAYGARTVTTGAGSVGLVQDDVYTYAAIPGSRIRVVSSTNNGTNAVFEVTVAGSTATLLTDTQTVTIDKVSGTGVSTFTVDVNMKIVDATITTKGSGYTGAETFTVTKVNGALGTAPVGTIVLTTDAGGQYQGYGDLNVNTYNENAILITAKTTSGGTASTGDIIKQTNARSYKVKTADGTAVCKLVAESPAVNQATINATDSDGGTYYVTKLTAHKALLTQNTGTQFATGTSVKWTFGDATEDYSVKIDNA